MKKAAKIQNCSDNSINEGTVFITVDSPVEFKRCRVFSSAKSATTICQIGLPCGWQQLILWKTIFMFPLAGEHKI